ncbi:MAG TPA: 23S rRNA (pseudouridine(1915)-N(3))-methyltransferase RlmH, partial [Phenylobacterium sp.]|nr:23S rRNA (pseudouridine(1915)-N(3))-methyltransferase RlmH [Phenylobacterium sp.]
MRVTILAVGRLARTPEVELVRLYIDRATAAGRNLGLGPFEV